MEIAINGINYKIEKLNAIKQFHVARRLAPAMWALGAAALTTLKGNKAGGDDNIVAALTQAAGPLVQVISSMSDADSQYVLDTCLSVCSRQETGGYQKVFVEGGGIMFKDIDLPIMLQLVLAAIRENLGNFLDALPAKSQEGGQSAA